MMTETLVAVNSVPCSLSALLSPKSCNTTNGKICDQTIETLKASPPTSKERVNIIVGGERGATRLSIEIRSGRSSLQSDVSTFLALKKIARKYIKTAPHSVVLCTGRFCSRVNNCTVRATLLTGCRRWRHPQKSTMIFTNTREQKPAKIE